VAIREALKQTAPVEFCPLFRLEITNPGMLDTLTLPGCERPAPGPAEVEIQIPEWESRLGSDVRNPLAHCHLESGPRTTQHAAAWVAAALFS
jgi:hypothetical protein